MIENQANSTEQATTQKEILKGHFILCLNDKMDTPLRIEKYAQEPVAYFLHKRRDFLERLFNKNNKFAENRELLEYQKVLRYIAGETKDGLER